MSTCFLIGSHLSPDALSPLLDEAIKRHIAEYGVTEFLVGRYGRFDQLAAEALRRAKERHPGIRLRLLIPYHPAQRPVDVPSGFDGTYYPEGMGPCPSGWPFSGPVRWRRGRASTSSPARDSGAPGPSRTTPSAGRSGA